MTTSNSIRVKPSLVNNRRFVLLSMNPPWCGMLHSSESQYTLIQINFQLPSAGDAESH
jgi:hypothetical protein